MLERLVGIPATQQHVPEIVVRERVVRPDPQRLLELIDRLIQPASDRQRRAEVEVRGGGFGLQSHRGFQMGGGFARPAQVQVEQRDIVVELDPRRILSNHALVADDILGHRFGSIRRVQDLQIAIVSRQHLDPQIAHLVV